MSADYEIRDKLKAEAPGILNRMLKGLADLQKHKGFTVIEGHDELIEDYKSSSNTIAEFLMTYFTFDYDAPKVSSKVLLNTYKKFCDDKYSQGLTPQRFGVLIGTNGLAQFDRIIPSRGANGVRMWSGLKLREEFEITDAEIIIEKAGDF
jgi:phage/plasmid-associated DNA primase